MRWPACRRTARGASAPQPFALVATSANPGGEPLVVDDDDAQRRLAGIADLIVTHDRPILVRADDSVMAIIDGAPAFMRRARGFVPEPIDLGDGRAVRARRRRPPQGDGDADARPRGVRLAACRRPRHRRDAALLPRDHRAPDGGARRHAGRRRLRSSSRLSPRRALPRTFGRPWCGCSTTPPISPRSAPSMAVAAPLLGVALDGYGFGDDGGNWGGELMIGRRRRRGGGSAIWRRWRCPAATAPPASPGAWRVAALQRDRPARRARRRASRSIPLAGGAWPRASRLRRPPPAWAGCSTPPPAFSALRLVQDVRGPGGDGAGGAGRDAARARRRLHAR